MSAITCQCRFQSESKPCPLYHKGKKSQHEVNWNRKTIEWPLKFQLMIADVKAKGWIHITAQHPFFSAYVSPYKGKQSMRDLYNSKVSSAEYVTRPLSDKDTKKNYPFVHHAGVRITTDSGDQYLVHKGPGYGKSSDTVVTPASYMSDRWRTKESKSVSSSTVGDFVQQGNADKPYSLFKSNCKHAAKSMWKNTD